MIYSCMCDCVQVAEALSRTKNMAVEAHARDELGIDLEDLDEKTNPLQVPVTLFTPALFAKHANRDPLKSRQMTRHADDAQANPCGVYQLWEQKVVLIRCTSIFNIYQPLMR